MKKLKCAFQDFTADDLPTTRKEVFFGCFKEHFSLILRVALVCFACFLPVIIVAFMRDSYIMNAIAELEEPTDESVVNITAAAGVSFGLVQIVAFTFFAVMFAGGVQIIRQMLWDEPVFFGDDFKNGLKSNSLKYGATGFILSSVGILLSMYGDSVVRYVLNGIFIAFIVPVAVWFVLQSIYYKSAVTASIKNAEVLYLKTVPVTILLLMLTIVPCWLVVNFISFLVVRYVLLLVLSLIGIVPLTMCWMLYATHIFDKLVNKENNPEIYRKGMKKQTEEVQSSETDA